MSLENILLLAGLIILAVILIRFLTKIIAKLLAFGIIGALIVYVLFFWNGGILNFGKNDFILYELEQKYCVEKNDSTRCNCIIRPLIEDIESKYDAEELEEIKQDRKKSLEVLMTSIRENQDEIKQCLKENNAGNSWKEFQEDLKSSWFNKKFKELLEKEEEERVEDSV